VRHYYYFAATLPTPQFGSPAPMGSGEFLERARTSMTAEDYAVVESAVLVSEPEGPPPAASRSTALRDYYNWERSLRNELVRARARKLGRQAEAHLRPAGRSGADRAEASAQAAAGAENPLDGELLLEQERWARIGDLKALHVFDLETLVAYRLQLQVLERLAALSPELGETRYRDTYAAILGAANTQMQTGESR
jgi:hypothetical protein